MIVEGLPPERDNDLEYLHYYETILNNPYVKLKPYPKQAVPVFEANKKEVDKRVNTVLVGAGGYGGKTILGSILAVQYLMEDDYTCLVTRRNYAELIDTNSIWENLLDWCCDEDRLGDLVCKSKKSPIPQIIAPNGNTIYFKAFDREDKKQKFKSASYDRIINDEASELPLGIIRFQYRSMRNTSRIPRSIINLSNPGGESTDYLVDRFVDGKEPYIPLDWRHNPFIDAEAYRQSLEELDYIDKQYQMYGDWHFKPTSGDLIDIETLRKSYINYDDYKDRIVELNIIGIDLAGSGRDNTAAVSLLVLNNGLIVMNDLCIDGTAYPEDNIYDFVDRQGERYDTYMINFEAEPGSDSIYSLRHWKKELDELIYKYGIIVKDTTPSKSKFNRARPVANAVKQGKLRFDDSLDLERKNGLFDQFIYVSPDLGEMKKLKSPDELDALGYAYTELHYYINR